MENTLSMGRSWNDPEVLECPVLPAEAVVPGSCVILLNHPGP